MEDIDELEPAKNGSTLPPAVRQDATRQEIVDAVNGLAIELQLVREAFQEQGTRIEKGFQRIEKLLGYARTRTTDPAPPPEGEGI